MLIAAVAVMQCFDLSLTLAFMRTMGMLELNPLARWVAAGGGPLALIVFKAATMSLCAGILISLRRRRSAEIGACVACAVMVLLSARWVDQIGIVADEFDSSPAATITDDRYVRL